MVPSERTSDKRHNLEDSKFHLNRKRSFFTLGVAEPCKRLPREVAESPSLETFL